MDTMDSRNNQGEQPTKRRGKRPLGININHLPDDSLVDKQVRSAVTGIRDSEAYKRIAEGRFPAPVKLGPRCSRWRLGDLRAWLADPMGWGK